jgi:hypothetical protein
LLCCHKQVPSRSRPLAAKYSLFKRADIVRKALWRRIWCLSPLNSKFVSSFNGEAAIGRSKAAQAALYSFVGR